MSSAPRTEIFYSKSKNKADLGKGIPATWRRQLSNFWPAEITIDGRTYPSVEAAFQAAKARHSSKPEMAAKFEVGGSVGPDPAEAKRHGTKAAFKAEGAVLKAKDWEKGRVPAMLAALGARLRADEEFRKILKASKEANVRLVHYERAGAKAYWGGAVKDGAVVGANALGEMMMMLRESLDPEAPEMAAAMVKALTGSTSSPEAAAMAAVMSAAGLPALAGPAPPPAVPVAPPDLASLGRASESIGAVSFTRKVFTARATLLTQLASIGYKVSHLQDMSPADVDRQIQDVELNFVVSGTTAGQGSVHVRFHVYKALRQIHVHNLGEELAEQANFNPALDSLVLISKDLPNDSVRSAVSGVWANLNINIVVRALAELRFNVLTHRDVPPHKMMSAAEVVELKKSVAFGPNGLKDLPGISRFDPAAQAILLRPGRVCEIMRPSQSAGRARYYRLCE